MDVKKMAMVAAGVVGSWAALEAGILIYGTAGVDRPLSAKAELSALVANAESAKKIGRYESDRARLAKLAGWAKANADGLGLLLGDPQASKKKIGGALAAARDASREERIHAQLALWLEQRGPAALEKLGVISNTPTISPEALRWIDDDMREWNRSSKLSAEPYDGIDYATEADYKSTKFQESAEDSNRMLIKLSDWLSMGRRFPRLAQFGRATRQEMWSGTDKEFDDFEMVLRMTLGESQAVLARLAADLPNAKMLTAGNIDKVSRSAEMGHRGFDNITQRWYEGSAAEIGKHHREGRMRELESWYAGEVMRAWEAAGEKLAGRLNRGLVFSGADPGRWWATPEADSMLGMMLQWDGAEGCLSSAEKFRRWGLEQEGEAAVEYAKTALESGKPAEFLARDLKKTALLRAWFEPDPARDAKLFEATSESLAMIRVVRTGEEVPYAYSLNEMVARNCPGFHVVKRLDGVVPGGIGMPDFLKNSSGAASAAMQADEAAKKRASELMADTRLRAMLAREEEVAQKLSETRYGSHH